MITTARHHFIRFAAASYAILALAWIFLSDQLLSLVASIDSIVWLSTAKGVFFVVATAALFYFAMSNVPPATATGKDATRDSAAVDAETKTRPTWPLYLFAVATIVALVIGLVKMAIGQAESHDRERATVTTQNVALLLDHEISGRFDRIDVVLQSIAYFHQSQSAERHADTARLNAYVNYQHQLLSDVANVGIIDRNGIVRFSDHAPTKDTVNVIDRDYFIRARDHPAAGIIVAGPFISRIHNQPVILLARRITTPDGGFAGIVFATLATSRFGELLSSVELGPQGAATIRNADLALVHRFPEAGSSNVGSRSVSSQLLDHLKAKPDGGTYVAPTQLDGIERINAYRKLGRYPFYVIVGLASNDRHGALRSEALILAGLGTLAILATMLAAGLVCRTYQRQAKDLEERARIDGELTILLTERTRLNAELAIRADEAEAANRSKSAFVANMSHEIRTPMNAILGLAYLLERMALPGDANEMVRKIRMAGRTLLSIINDILDFSKIESGKLEIEVAPFRLGDVLDNLSTIMSANAGEKELELIIALPPKKTSLLRGDALRLEQVLINLTSNAIKFTERGHVAVSIAVVSESESEITLRFSVSDSGIGIAFDKQREIFAPFAQADGSTSRRFGGSGLGLTISRRLVASMGGQLQLTSVPGSGSEFWFVLTFARGQDSWLAAPEMTRLPVLIADDNPIAREALHSIVNGLGWQATTVGSGEDAVRHVKARLRQRGKMEILLLDFRMPGMDGLSAARAIRHELKDANDPIIIMVTAFSSNQLLDHPDSHLADAVLSKPVTPSSLYNAVARAMRVRQGGEEQIPSRPQQRLAGLRIQVVDDSEINREVAQRILAGEGAQVVVAEDGQQALDWLQAHPTEVDVVLMDVQMPVMNGYEATRQIRRIPALAELPVIALTAGAFMEQQELANEAGMNSFIAKPFDVDAAIALIMKITGRVAPAASAQATEAIPFAGGSDQDFPGLAVAQGLKVWRKAAVYRKFLRIFARDYADVAGQIARSGTAEAAALAHKLKGAAGNMALSDVSALAGEIERLLRAGENPADCVTRLQAALTTVLASIDRYAPPNPESASDAS